MTARRLRHVDATKPRGPIYRAWVRLVGTPPMAWVSRHIGWKLDPLLMGWSGGRVGFGMGMPTAVLETIGARTGVLRRNVVIYFHDGERATIVASHMGLPVHPSWFHNAVAHPDVTLGGEAFRAEVVTDEAERARLWALADNVLPLYAKYRKLTAETGRTIPILQLVPR